MLYLLLIAFAIVLFFIIRHASATEQERLSADIHHISTDAKDFAIASGDIVVEDVKEVANTVTTEVKKV